MFQSPSVGSNMQNEKSNKQQGGLVVNQNQEKFSVSDNQEANRQKYKQNQLRFSPSLRHTHTHTHSLWLSGSVSWADMVPWRWWEIVSMPDPTKASFQPPACLTCAGSALCFVPRDPWATRGSGRGLEVKSKCLHPILPRPGYLFKSAVKICSPPRLTRSNSGISKLLKPPSTSAHYWATEKHIGTLQSNWATVEYLSHSRSLSHAHTGRLDPLYLH